MPAPRRGFADARPACPDWVSALDGGVPHSNGSGVTYGSEAVVRVGRVAARLRTFFSTAAVAARAGEWERYGCCRRRRQGEIFASGNGQVWRELGVRRGDNGVALGQCPETVRNAWRRRRSSAFSCIMNPAPSCPHATPVLAIHPRIPAVSLLPSTCMYASLRLHHGARYLLFDSCYPAVPAVHGDLVH